MPTNVHKDCLGRPVNPGDFLTDNFVTFQVVCLHGSGQFVHADEAGALVTNFCCCFTVCPPPAPQSPGDSLEAPAEAVQEVRSYSLRKVSFLRSHNLYHTFLNFKGAGHRQTRKYFRQLRFDAGSVIAFGSAKAGA